MTFIKILVLLMAGVGLYVGGITIGIKMERERIRYTPPQHTMVVDAWSEFHTDGSSIADQGNNPGCITAGFEKYDTLAIGYIRGTGSYKFLVFPDSATGWYALDLRIRQDSAENIGNFMRGYCKNLPQYYLNNVLQALNAKETDRVSDHLDKIKIIQKTIAQQEGWKTGHQYHLRPILKH